MCNKPCAVCVALKNCMFIWIAGLPPKYKTVIIWYRALPLFCTCTLADNAFRGLWKGIHILPPHQYKPTTLVDQGLYIGINWPLYIPFYASRLLHSKASVYFHLIIEDKALAPMIATLLLLERVFFDVELLIIIVQVSIWIPLRFIHGQTCILRILLNALAFQFYGYGIKHLSYAFKGRVLYQDKRVCRPPMACIQYESPRNFVSSSILTCL